VNSWFQNMMLLVYVMVVLIEEAGLFCVQANCVEEYCLLLFAWLL
jgi:hypothetical protein